MMPDLPDFYELKNGLPVFIRPFRPSDINQILIGFSKMSERSRYRRFFHPVRELPESHLKELLDVDGYNNLAICAGVIHPDGWEGAGIARFKRIEPNSKTADIALTIIDKYQGYGLGGLLVEVLTRKALEAGVSSFEGHVLPDNVTMIKILKRRNAQNQLIEGPVYHFRMPLCTQDIRALHLTDQFEQLDDYL
ncbi:GNAT family N-acetyltransferase [bacterium]|nr:GNAT family N-acetyltransferase [bacterium]